MRLQGQGLAVSEKTKLETHVPTYVQCAQCTCKHVRRKCAVTLPQTYANLITIGSQAKHQLLAQSVNRFLRYGDERGDARAHVQGYPVLGATNHPHIPDFLLIFAPCVLKLVAVWDGGGSLQHGKELT